jgi:NAD(P)-dependent dehydrogenase (short-subunit alcohol dehydrogenase family)
MSTVVRQRQRRCSWTRAGASRTVAAMQELRNRVAVITGAGSGIGRALAERFVEEGMKVALADVQRDALDEVETSLRSRGGAVSAILTDVARAEQVDALARHAVDAFGAVHVVCNNAGVAVGGLAWEQSVEEWEWVLGVNLWGVIHGIRTFVPRLLAQGGEGHVVNTASMAGLLTGPGMAPYYVSKHAVVALSETLQHELSSIGSRIKVSVLCPGWVNTRIAESERNRPASLPAGVQRPEVDAMSTQVRQRVATGLDPSVIADLVVRGIREERFYLLSHPEWKDLIEARMQAIVGERSPTLPIVG